MSSFHGFWTDLLTMATPTWSNHPLSNFSPCKKGGLFQISSLPENSYYCQCHTDKQTICLYCYDPPPLFCPPPPPQKNYFNCWVHYYTYCTSRKSNCIKEKVRLPLYTTVHCSNIFTRSIKYIKKSFVITRLKINSGGGSSVSFNSKLPGKKGSQRHVQKINK